MPIVIKNLSYVYSKKTPDEYEALHDINLEIKDGSFTCIVGKTGCGKSTLVQQINGLLTPTCGSVSYKDFVISSKKKECKGKIIDIRKDIGMVFQFSENQLFEETVLKDVMFGPLNFGMPYEEAERYAKECIEMTGLNESYFNRSPFELSGGEKRRISVAGIIASKPSVLILDEPTAGLDSRGSKKVLQFFKRLNEKGTTIILVTHDMNIVYEYADDVIVLDDGKVVAHKTPVELFSENVEKYSLETPTIVKIANLLREKHVDIDLNNIKNGESLINELKRVRK